MISHRSVPVNLESKKEERENSGKREGKINLKKRVEKGIGRRRECDGMKDDRERDRK